jgi:hypothetical protein
MKKIILSLFLLLSTTLSHADNPVPDDISVREHWISLTKSYDIETKEKKLGTLYRRFFSLRLTYDFYDAKDIKTASAKAKFFSFGPYLTIDDQNDTRLGSVKEKIFSYFTTFEIFAPDESTQLARAEMNFWGTKFTVYDPVTSQEMAIMSRSYFRLKNNWTLHVSNQAVLEQKNLDPRVLMTVLAIQGEIEDWKKDHKNKSSLNAKQTLMHQQIATLSTTEQFEDLENPSEESLEILAEELEQQFNTENPSTHNARDEEHIQAFITFCLQKSQELPDAKKKAILSLLNLRLHDRL